jgi:hypothetical protein
MKKIALFFVSLLFIVGTFAQKTSTTWVVLSATDNFRSSTHPGDHIINTGTATEYYVISSSGRLENITTALAASKIELISYLNVATFDTSYLHTTGTDRGYGTYTWYGANTFANLLTASVLPSFTIAAGHATPTLVADTVNVAVAGLTTSAIILCGYAATATTTVTFDTLARVYAVRTSNFTLSGKHGLVINYWIPKK